MPKFRLSTEAVGYLEAIIEAENEQEAWNKMEKMLEAGEMPEVGGEIDNERVEELE